MSKIHIDPTIKISDLAFIKDKSKVSIEIGSKICEFVRLSTTLKVGRFSEIGPHASIMGGLENTCTLGDFSTIVAGARIWLQSDDYKDELLTPATASSIEGDVTFENYTGVGTNSVIMPKNTIPEGTVIGALSFVPSKYSFEPWMIYAGCPIRPIKPRNRDIILRQVEEIEKEIKKTHL